MTILRYAVIIERGPTGCSAYLPDLWGCVAAGDSEAGVVQLIREAVELHVQMLREDGDAVPQPATRVIYADVTLPGADA